MCSVLGTDATCRLVNASNDEEVARVSGTIEHFGRHHLHQQNQLAQAENASRVAAHETEMARAKDWAFTEKMGNNDCFPTFRVFCDSLKETFLPPNSDFRYRARLLALKQGKKDLHTYVQEIRYLASSLATRPIPQDVLVTIFMQGMRIGPARAQLFRTHPETLEEAIRIDFREDNSQRQSASSSNAPRRANDDMDLSMIDVRCHRCGRTGHYEKSCYANLRGNTTSNPRRFGGPPNKGGRTSYRGNRSFGGNAPARGPARNSARPQGNANSQ